MFRLRTVAVVTAVVLCAAVGATASCRTDADCPSSYCVNDKTKSPPYQCHSCGDLCCLTDKDCPGSYCSNDPTKMPPYVCHSKVLNALRSTVAQDPLTPATSNVEKEVKTILDKYQKVIAGVTIALGFVVTFVGYKLVGPTLFITGAAAGGFVTYVVTNWAIAEDYSKKPIIVITTTIAAALLAGIILNRLRKLGMFLAGACGGGAAAFMLNTAVLFRLKNYAPEAVPSLYLYIAIVILGLICGYLALKLERLVFIVATSVTGSFGVCAGIGYFAGHYPTSYQSFVQNDNEDPLVWAYLAGMVAMSLLGVAVQLRTTEPKRKSAASNRESLLYYPPAPAGGLPRSVNTTAVAGFGV